MKDFSFHYDQKVTVWCRTNFTIEADTQEEANKKAIDLRQAMSDDIGWEIMYETAETLTPSENGNQSTEEIFLEGTLIYSNEPVNIIRDKKIDTLVT